MWQSVNPVRSLSSQVGFMNRIYYLLCWFFWTQCLYANPISTFAGGGVGDGILATQAVLLSPRNVCFGPAGEMYIADSRNYRIRKYNPETGLIVTVAGNGHIGYTGDGGLATRATLNVPTDVATNQKGDIYIADSENNCIRKIDTQTGIITTVAGNGDFEFAGDGGLAIHASLKAPLKICIAPNGDLFIADTANDRVRKVDMISGIITTVVGNGETGYSGDGMLAHEISLQSPRDLAMDSQSNLYVVDRGRSRLIMINTKGIISTLGHPDGERFVLGELSSSSITWGKAYIDSDSEGNIYLLYNENIWHINQQEGEVVNVTENISQAIVEVGGEIKYYQGLNFYKGTVYLSGQNHILAINLKTPIPKIIAGYGVGDSGSATNARLETPSGIAVDRFGNVYISEKLGHRIRKVDLSGKISTVAGTGIGGWDGDGGLGSKRKLRWPMGIFVDHNGNLYIADSGNHRIRRVDGQSGIIQTIAGDGIQGYLGDGGLATQAKLSLPQDVFVNLEGHIYIADTDNHRIRKVDAESGVITTVAGEDHELSDFTHHWGGLWFYGDGGIATLAGLSHPTSVWVDQQNNIFFADRSNHSIRKVDPFGIITTVVGNQKQRPVKITYRDVGYDVTDIISYVGNFSGDDELASQASLSFPTDICVDQKGNLYVADTDNHRIRRVDAETGVITTVVGDGYRVGNYESRERNGRFYGEHIDATRASLNGPRSISIGASGALFVADMGNHLIRKIEGIGQSNTVSVENTSADFDKDGKVDFADFLVFVLAFGTKSGDPAYQSERDLNLDGVVDFFDFLIFAQAFGSVK